MKDDVMLRNPEYATRELMWLTGLTRLQLQRMEEKGVLIPSRKGKKGRGYATTWTIMQAVGLAYARVFMDAGCHTAWAYDAARWVSRANPGELVIAFMEGRTFLNLSPVDRRQSRLEAPYLPPKATREQRLMLMKLDLEKCYWKVMFKALDLLPAGTCRDGVRECYEAERASIAKTRAMLGREGLASPRKKK
jgi:hypothetical protein